MDLNIAVPGKKKATGSVQVSDTTFGREFNEALVHQVIVAYQAGGRQGSHQQKTRAQVRGGGKKPFGQKGTGQARAGTIRSPLWRKGGIIFAAVPQDYSQKVNRQMYRGAMRAILSELIRQGRLTVVEELALKAPRTKEFVGIMKDLGLKQVLVVTDAIEENLYLAARNVPNVEVRDVAHTDPVSLVHYPQVVMTVAAIKKFEELLA